MGDLKVFWISNGGSVKTDVTYALAGVQDGEVVHEDRHKQFWTNVNKAMKEREETANADQSKSTEE